MPTENVHLSEHQAEFIRQSIDEGRYLDAGEVVRAGLRLLEQHDKEDKLKLNNLRRLAVEAFDEIDRGEFEVIGPEDLDGFMARIDADARAAQPR